MSAAPASTVGDERGPATHPASSVADERGAATQPVSTVASAPPWRRERRSWRLAEGAEIAPGRTVLRRLGGGRRFDVFLVWDEHRLALLVAKLLRPDQADDDAARRELLREAHALDRLRHPVIVRAFDVVADGRFPHLLIEHLEGPTLHDLLADGPLALEQVLPLGLHLASALHYMAGEGMVHLDVKPDNVVMGAPPRLIDLSVARTVAAASRLRAAVGTDGYMAPEQRDPASHPIGPPADVYGLAATIRRAIEPRRAPQPLLDLVRAGLEPDPAARPTARELALALEPLVAATPPPARRGWRRAGSGRRSR